MVLPRSVVRTLSQVSLFYVSVVAATAPLETLRNPAPQTVWQKELFKNVSESAAQQSEAALPALLARLDSAQFREELAKCCPSVSGLTAAQLLDRLQEQTYVSEVISGFPAVVDIDSIYPDMPVMSIADGLRGEFFQNSWQGVLLDSKNPDWTFHKAYFMYATVSCRDGMVKFAMWTFTGCDGDPDFSGSYPLDQCMSDESVGGIIKFTGNDTRVTQMTWLHSRKSRQRSESRTPRSFMSVPCPSDPPSSVQSYIADDRCHKYASFNASAGWQMEDAAERESYGLKPFATAGAPKSLQEAAERGPYCIVNQFLYDQGSLLYGDVSAVFSFQAVQDTALLSAIDTGFYQSVCKTNQTDVWKLANCSVYEPFRKLGTMRHFYHLFLINDDFWTGASVLAKHFARLEGDWGSHPVSGSDLLNYWEALPAATLHYPHGIKFLIGSFPALFGSATGASLQQWAKQRGWVLVWSLGANFGQDFGMSLFRLLMLNQTFALNQRLLDPVVALNTTAGGNLSLGAGLLGKFRRSWAMVEALRKRSSNNVSNSTWAKQWHRLMRALPPKLHMRPLKAGSCARSQDGPECVGVNGDGHCVCYSQATVAPPPTGTELII